MNTLIKNLNSIMLSLLIISLLASCTKDKTLPEENKNPIEAINEEETNPVEIAVNEEDQNVEEHKPKPSTRTSWEWYLWNGEYGPNFECTPNTGTCLVYAVHYDPSTYPNVYDDFITAVGYGKGNVYEFFSEEEDAFRFMPMPEAARDDILNQVTTIIWYEGAYFIVYWDSTGQSAVENPPEYD